MKKFYYAQEMMHHESFEHIVKVTIAFEEERKTFTEKFRSSGYAGLDVIEAAIEEIWERIETRKMEEDENFEPEDFAFNIDDFMCMVVKVEITDCKLLED